MAVTAESHAGLMGVGMAVEAIVTVVTVPRAFEVE